VWFSVGVFANVVLLPLVGKSMARELALRPYYPLLIAFGVLTGYLAQLRWSRLCTPWVWVLPGAYLLFTMLSWAHAGYSLADTLEHFFSKSCWPSCEDQYVATWPLYSSVAYSLGIVLHRVRLLSQTGMRE